MEEHCTSLLQHWGQTCDYMAGNLSLRDTWSLLPQKSPGEVQAEGQWSRLYEEERRRRRIGEPAARKVRKSRETVKTLAAFGSAGALREATLAFCTSLLINFGARRVERRKSAAGQQTRTEPKDFVDRLTRRNGELLQEQNSKESRRDRMRQREGWSGGAPEAPEDFVATRVGDETDATATDNGTGRRITER
ncbi:hypothetical protein MTO96_006052 [Rhipicephalus appendiculatus]